MAHTVSCAALRCIVPDGTPIICGTVTPQIRWHSRGGDGCSLLISRIDTQKVYVVAATTVCADVPRVYECLGLDSSPTRTPTTKRTGRRDPPADATVAVYKTVQVRLGFHGPGQQTERKFLHFSEMS